MLTFWTVLLQTKIESMTRCTSLTIQYALVAPVQVMGSTVPGDIKNI